MTTTDIERRPIIRFPDYVIGVDTSVWSVDRTRPGKSGSTRRIPGKQLTPDTANRVWLTAEGRRERHNVDRLYRLHFPDQVSTQPQAWCRRGHPLLPYQHDRMASWVEPEVAYWGQGNRVCLYCHPGWSAPPRPAVTPARPYWCSPPMLRDGERTIGIRRDRENIGRARENVRRDADDDSDDDLLARGYTVSTLSSTNHVPFPTVSLVPDHLRGLDAIIRRAP